MLTSELTAQFNKDILQIALLWQWGSKLCSEVFGEQWRGWYPKYCHV